MRWAGGQGGVEGNIFCPRSYIAVQQHRLPASYTRVRCSLLRIVESFSSPNLLEIIVWFFLFSLYFFILLILIHVYHVYEYMCDVLFIYIYICLIGKALHKTYVPVM